MTGSMEDLDRDQQLERAKLISAALVDVVTEHQTPMYVSEATAAAADRLGISPSQVSYGVSFARNTGALRFNESSFQLQSI